MLLLIFFIFSKLYICLSSIACLSDSVFLKLCDLLLLLFDFNLAAAAALCVVLLPGLFSLSNQNFSFKVSSGVYLILLLLFEHIVIYIINLFILIKMNRCQKLWWQTRRRKFFSAIIILIFNSIMEFFVCEKSINNREVTAKHQQQL